MDINPVWRKETAQETQALQTCQEESYVSRISLGETGLEVLAVNLKEWLQENEATYETLEKKSWMSKMAHGVKVIAAKSDNQSSISAYHVMAGGTKSKIVFRPPWTQ